MSEQLRINPLEQSARRVIENLQSIESRVYPSQIEAVFVFSGPGTYYHRLKPDQPDWMRWQDRDRLRAGTAVVREVTASRKTEELGLAERLKGSHMSHDDINRFGPLMVYNGVPIKDPELYHENIWAKFAAESNESKIPTENVLLINDMDDDEGGRRPLYHTGDQVKSMFQNLFDEKSDLYNVQNIALVSHLAHFVRIPFYLKKYENEFVSKGGYKPIFYAYPLKGRPGTLEGYIDSEIARLLEYASRGDIATEPVNFKG